MNLIILTGIDIVIFGILTHRLSCRIGLVATHSAPEEALPDAWGPKTAADLRNKTFAQPHACLLDTPAFSSRHPCRAEGRHVNSRRRVNKHSEFLRSATPDRLSEPDRTR